MRTTIRKAHRWPIGASRTVDHAPLREGERLPGCRMAMVDRAVDTTPQVAMDSSTGRRTGCSADITWHVETDSFPSLRTAMVDRAVDTIPQVAMDSSTDRRTAMVGHRADTTRHVAIHSSIDLPTAMRRTGN